MAIGQREAEILDAYETWEPDGMSVTGLCEQLGISRARLYAVLEKHGVVPKSKRVSAELSSNEASTLTDQVIRLAIELGRYRERFGPMPDEPLGPVED